LTFPVPSDKTLNEVKKNQRKTGEGYLGRGAVR